MDSDAAATAAQMTPQVWLAIFAVVCFVLGWIAGQQR